VDAAPAALAVEAMTRRLVGAGGGPTDDAVTDRISQLISYRLQLSDDGRGAFARMRESPDDKAAKADVIRTLQFELDRDQVFAKTIQDLLSGKIDPNVPALNGSEPGWDDHPVGTAYESPKKKSRLPGLLILGLVAVLLLGGIAVGAVVLPARISKDVTATSTSLPTAATSSKWRSLAVLNVRANDITFNAPWGDMLATADVAGTVSLWRTPTHKLVATLDSTNGTGPTGVELKSVAFNATASRLVAGGLRGTIELWNINTGTLVRAPFGNKNVLHAIYGVAFAPNGKTVASASQDGTVRIWSATTGEQIGNPIIPSQGQDGEAVAVNAVAFSPNGRLLASLSDDGTVTLWDPATHEKIRETDSPSTTVGTDGDKLAFRPDGKVIATVSAAGLHMWDTRTGRTMPVIATDAIGACAFKGDGTLFATGSITGPVRTYDPNTLAAAGNLPGDLRFVDALAFAKSGTYLAAADRDNAVHIWTSAK
jgi:WD40 repeat protein